MNDHLKRTIDVVISTTALLLASPLMAIIASAVMMTMGRPVLFRQTRPGYQGRPFALLKFRTMREAIGPAGRPVPDSQRLTRFGRLLRRTSLDELPQLWNVLMGELSLVGPRPLLMEYLPLYTPKQMRRHEVKPGITGWAQVNGRNTLSWEEKLTLDVWYVEHCSILLDLKILGLTIVTVLSGEGVAARGEATVAPFSGSSGAGS
jgi:lipopolysaccharide/colanic/teichoic acid biosynthesis glycosyltransferase